MSGFDSRPCGPGEIVSWKKFLDQSFGYQAPQSYAVDFAPLFEASALTRSRLLWKDGKIVCSATLHPTKVVTPYKEIKLGIIGAVATDETFRGQGLSSQVLNELEASARAMGLEGVVLWSDQNEFYSKRGYAAVGRQEIYGLSTLKQPDSLAQGKPVYGWDLVKVPSLYDAHPMRTARSPEYWKAIEGIRSCVRLQWMSPDGEILAYLGFDRGRDLQGIIHEWGGDPHALHSLAWVLTRTKPALLWLTHPDLKDPIRSQVDESPLVSGTMCFFKPLSASINSSDLNSAWFWGLDSL